MNLDELRATAVEWLIELKPWTISSKQHWDDYIYSDEEWKNFVDPDSLITDWVVDNDILHIMLYTEEVRYEIRAKIPGDTTASYLLCTASARKQRVGENHYRGNDITGGPLNKDTFDKIVKRMLGYELKAKRK